VYRFTRKAAALFYIYAAAFPVYFYFHL